MGWYYGIIRVKDPLADSGYSYSICEVYPGVADRVSTAKEKDLWTGPTELWGDTPEGLLKTLDLVRKDLEKVIARGEIRDEREDEDV